MVLGNLQKQLKNNRGMTLVEVLLSISVLGILSVLVLGMFVNTFGLINRSGDLDKTGYTAAKVTENAIAGMNVTQDGSNVKIDNLTYAEDIANTTITSNSDPVSITFNESTSNEKDISVKGKGETIKTDGYNNQVTIEVFIPDENQH